MTKDTPAQALVFLPSLTYIAKITLVLGLFHPTRPYAPQHRSKKPMSLKYSIQRCTRKIPCVILIGMPGAGKTTIGKYLARRLNWPYIDSDHLIEAAYGRRLQAIVDKTSKEEFLDIERTVVCSIRAQRCVLGTGGSVVYRSDAMQHLRSLGCIVYLEVPLNVLKERVAANPQRGIAIGPGQSFEDIFREREHLYTQWSDFSCSNSGKSIEDCVEYIYARLPDAVTSKQP